MLLFLRVVFDFVLCSYRTCTSLRKNQSKVKLTTRNHRERAGSFFFTFFSTNQIKKHIFTHQSNWHVLTTCELVCEI